MNDEKVKGNSPKPRKNAPPSTRKDFYKELCWKWYSKGYSQIQVQGKIKEDTGRTIDIRTIKVYIEEALQTCRIQKPDWAKDVTVLELQKINFLEMEYWEGYERSKRPATTIKQKFVPVDVAEFEEKDGPGRKKKKGVTQKLKLVDEIHETRPPQPGDIKFLLGVQWCVEQRLLILGHSASEKPKLQKPLTEEDKNLIEESEKLVGAGKRMIVLHERKIENG